MLVVAEVFQEPKLLRIVTWNVNQKLPAKWAALLALRPDLAILPEVAQSDLFALAEASNARAEWIGSNPVKGLGVVSFGSFGLERDPGFDPRFEFFLPLKITGPVDFSLLGAWAMNHRAGGELAGQRDTTLQAIRHYREFLGQGPAVFAGDLNHNIIWDRPRATTGNFRHVIDALRELGMQSAFHRVRGEEYGEETAATIHWRRNPEQPYHVDYCFAPTRWLEENAGLEIVQPGAPAVLSDHWALILEVATEGRDS